MFTAWPVFLLLICYAEAQNIKVLLVVDSKNNVAMNSAQFALDSLKKNMSGVMIKQQSTVIVDGDNSSTTMDKVCQALTQMIDATEPPDLVLDLTIGGPSSEAVKSISRAYGLPTITASHGTTGDIRSWKDLTSAEEKYLIQVRPPGDTMPDIVRELVKNQNITNAGILYDDSTFDMINKYRSLLINLPVRHVIVPIKTSQAELSSQLTRLRNIDISNFFIFGSMSALKNVYSTASSLKMFGEKFAWFAATKEQVTDFDATCCKEMKVVFLHPMPVPGNKMKMAQTSGLQGKPELESGFYYDITIKAVNAVNSMKQSKTWPDMSIAKCNDPTVNSPVIRNLDLLSAFQASVIQSTYGPLKLSKNGMNYMEFLVNVETNNIKNASLIERFDIGYFVTGMPSKLVYNLGMENKLSDYKAKTVYRVVTVLQAPFMMKNASGSFYGYCVDLIEELRKMMNFEYELYEAKDGLYGQMDSKTEWNGMIRELLDKNADVALGALSVMAERENVIDFTVPYYDLVGITILMKKPKVPTSLFKFLSVLEDSVWICILAAYIITSVIMWIFDRWSPYSYQNNIEKYEDDDEKRFFNLKECLWFCMTSLTPQGGGEAPKNLSGRLVAATWWLFGFIIIASYTANLAAFLTVSRLETPVESLEDLSKQYKIKYAPLNGSASATYFERMAYIEDKFYEIWKDMSLNDSLSELERSKLAVWDYPVSDKYTKIWQSMQEAGLPSTEEEAYARVRASPSSSEGFAFLGDATDIRYQTLTNCDLQMVGDEFSRKPYALAVQQGSPLKDQFNDAILKLLNQRKLETLKERWWNQNPEKKVCDDTEEDGGGISIHNIGGVFIVIFVGIGLAIITLGIEYWYYKYRKPAEDSNGRMVASDVHMKKHNASEKEIQLTFSGKEGMVAVANPW